MRLFMKNTWQLFICLVFLAACSDDAVEDQTTISLPPETEALFEKGLNFTKDADTQSLEFTTTEDWSITAAETRNGEKCYRIYPTSGKAGEVCLSRYRSAIGETGRGILPGGKIQ